MRKTRTTKTRIGASRRNLLSLVAAGFGVKFLQGDSYALIAGTVFREPGFALPGAEITVQLEPPAGAKRKAKTWMARSDGRGEFAVRVPAGQARYRLTVQAKGFTSQQRTVEIYGDERADLYFSLQPLSQ